jgi:hypothetical protein
VPSSSFSVAPALVPKVEPVVEAAAEVEEGSVKEESEVEEGEHEETSKEHVVHWVLL